jgi:hypothetical protein
MNSSIKDLQDIVPLLYEVVAAYWPGVNASFS